MRRREFITLVGGAAAVWPVAARAERRIPTIGFLHPGSPAEMERFVAAFRHGLSEVDFVEGQNVAIEFRWAEGRADRLPELAADLVRHRVDVIATPGNVGSTLAAKRATAAIPIVFGVPDDPVKFGLVASLARPGSNATGISYFANEIQTKRLGLLHELVPPAQRVAVLVNPRDEANAEATEKEIAAGAQTLGLKAQVVRAATGDEIDAVFATLARARPDALFVAPGAFFNSRRVQLAILAAHQAIPAAYSVRDYVEAGGLMSYGPSILWVFRQVGVYAGRILKGQKPADLPVLQPTKLELALNLRTANALGLTIPQGVLAITDEVIE
jgi:putative tryptophan/tyrosine transport system substrate-binding protein